MPAVPKRSPTQRNIAKLCWRSWLQPELAAHQSEIIILKFFEILFEKCPMYFSQLLNKLWVNLTRSYGKMLYLRRNLVCCCCCCIANRQNTLDLRVLEPRKQCVTLNSKHFCFSQRRKRWCTLRLGWCRANSPKHVLPNALIWLTLWRKISGENGLKRSTKD